MRVLFRSFSSCGGGVGAKVPRLALMLKMLAPSEIVMDFRLRRRAGSGGENSGGFVSERLIFGAFFSEIL